MITVTWHPPVVRRVLDGFNRRVKKTFEGFWRATDADDPTDEYPLIAVDWKPESDEFLSSCGESFEHHGLTHEEAARLFDVLHAALEKRCEVFVNGQSEES